MKINDRDFDEFGLPRVTTHRLNRPKRKGRKTESRFDDWSVESRRKKDKPWRGKTNRQS